MTITESFTAATTQARKATEKSVESWKQGAQTLTDQGSLLTRWTKFDLSTPVERYFEFLQQSIDVNREMARSWVSALGSLTGVVRDQAEKVESAVRDNVTSIADATIEKAEKAEKFADEQAEKLEKAAEEKAEQAEQAKKEEARKARAAEREQAKQAYEKAREAYEGKTKAELSELLADRDLPKTGNVEDLIERLVESDKK
jgi:hypothetical protein